MNSCVTYAMTLYGGIFEDIAAWFPDIRNSLEKDQSYLRRATIDRGISFFTLTLPAFGQWLDRSLDQGAFVDRSVIPRGIPLFHGRPRLFWGILKKVFSTDGVLLPESDPQAVFYLRTLCQSLKKLEIPVESKTVLKTIEEFYNVEENLPKSYPETWDSDVPIWGKRTGHPLWGDSVPAPREQPDLFGYSRDPWCSAPWDTLLELSRRALSEIGVPDYDRLRPKHGPGAVSESGWVSKYEFPIWPRKLGLWFPADWYGYGDLSSRTTSYSDREPPSKLRAVPKTAKGPRLICKEPIAHQWMQQSIWRWLEGRVKKTVLGRSLNFRSQLASQDRAREASHSGLYATLDLSAASDRLSTRLVEYLFQGQEILDSFHAVRTRVLEQTLHDKLPKLIVLRKFSTMGSALTFPVQSIVFTLLSVWALRLYEGRENDWANWKEDFDRVRVFGDDIIVPTHAYGLTKRVLHTCGLLVNASKSFGGTSFRESCGMDAFKGVDVTPPRHRLPYNGDPESTAALIMYSNNLHTKGLWNAANKALGLLPVSQRKLLLTGRPDDGILGLVSYCGRNYNEFRSRYDRNLQRAFVFHLGFTSKVRHKPGRAWSNLTQFFTEDPSKEVNILEDVFLWKAGRVTPGRVKMARSRHYL